MSLLELKNISKSYLSKVGNFQVIKKLNLSVDHNQNIFLFGPSGCGKSTLLNLISGLDSSDSGEIYFDGKLVKNHFDLLKDDIGIIFQDHYLISELNIFDNIKLKVAIREKLKKSYLILIWAVLNLNTLISYQTDKNKEFVLQDL